MTATLRALSDLIAAAVADIERSCAVNSFEFPSLDDIFTLDSEKARFDPIILQSTTVIVAAASQLIATVREPSITLISLACGFHISSALQTVLVTNVVECLRPHGSKGLHANQIANATGVDETKLDRLLRLLCTFHIFREVTPNVFTNNRLSSLLDTGKALATLQSQPGTRHDGTQGLAPLLEHFTDEIFKSSAYMTEHLLDPATSQSVLPTSTAMNRAFNHDLDVFSWFELPENQYRLKRFSSAMVAAGNAKPVGIVDQGFEWVSCAENDLIVDVGGGIGSATLELYLAYPALHFVVQDRDNVIADAREFWSNKAPAPINSGQVQLRAHDFMQPQPIKTASIFLLRKVLHDWADPIATQILRHLRDSATPSTKLLVIDHILPYACMDPSDNQTIPGAAIIEAPAPLLANMGQASALSYITDIQMLVAFNSQERTLGQFVELFKNTGWKLVQVYGAKNIAAMKHLLATPDELPY